MIDELAALHLSLLPEPDLAVQYLEFLQTGMRPPLCAKKIGVTDRVIRDWQAKSSIFSELCADAEAIGTSEIDDVVVSHVKAGTPGWSGAAKLVLQRRDLGYADASKVQSNETVNVTITTQFEEGGNG
jgi:hypothetical protein